MRISKSMSSRKNQDILCESAPFLLIKLSSFTDLAHPRLIRRMEPLHLQCANYTITLRKIVLNNFLSNTQSTINKILAKRMRKMRQMNHVHRAL